MVSFLDCLSDLNRTYHGNFIYPIVVYPKVQELESKGSSKNIRLQCYAFSSDGDSNTRIRHEEAMPLPQIPHSSAYSMQAIAQYFNTAPCHYLFSMRSAQSPASVSLRLCPP